MTSQLQVLNDDFQLSGLNFSLERIDYTENVTWYKGLEYGSEEVRDMKRALRVGGVADLNVYSVS